MANLPFVAGQKAWSETKLAVEPSHPGDETSDFASLTRDRFAFIQLTSGTYVSGPSEEEAGDLTRLDHLSSYFLEVYCSASAPDPARPEVIE